MEKHLLKLPLGFTAMNRHMHGKEEVVGRDGATERLMYALWRRHKPLL